MLSDILLTIFLVALNGFFVAAEFSLVKVRASQLEIRMASGNRFAKLAKHILDNLYSYLSATQLGITLASLGLGWIGEPVVSQIIVNAFHLFGVEIPPELTHKIALPIAFVSITVLHIVFGELAPKSLAIQRSESVAMFISIPLQAFYLLFRPFIWLLNKFAGVVLGVIGISITQEYEIHSAEELRYLLEQSHESGAIESDEHELIENVFEFAERTAKQIMVARTKISAIEISTPAEDMLEKVIEEGYSRLPVFQDTIDNIVGIVYAKDLLTMSRHSELIILQDILRPAYFIPETKHINELLKDFQRKHIQIAIVVDEFGGTSGIVTNEDVIEELVGEIQDEYDEETPIVTKIGENEFTVKASSAITDVNEHLPIPLPESEEYDTVGGLMNDIFGKIPTAGESIEFGGYECTILTTFKRSVDSVRLRQLSETEIIVE